MEDKNLIQKVVDVIVQAFKWIVFIPVRAYHRIRLYIKHEGLRAFFLRVGTIIIVVLAVWNLAYSQIHIKMIYNLFNRIIGLVMFGFILFGLVTIFAVTRLNASRGSVIRAIGSTLVTMALGVLYLTMMFQDVNTEEAVNILTIWDAMMSTIIILSGYTLGIVSFVVGEFVYGNK